MQVDVSEELYHHFQQLKEMAEEMRESAADKDRIAAMNALTTMIRELVKVQEELYNSTTFALFQKTLVTVLEDTSPELVEIFFRKLAAVGCPQ